MLSAHGTAPKIEDEFKEVLKLLNFDIKGMVEGFKAAPRHEAHEMVEEAMLAANESVAAHCISHQI